LLEAIGLIEPADNDADMRSSNKPEADS
jgi:hypothetical protein